MDFTAQISARSKAVDLWEMMSVKLLLRRPHLSRLRNARAACLGVVCLWSLTTPALAEKPAQAPASASREKNAQDAPAANVSKLQAWKDAEAIAALAPGRTEVIGAGDSMKPVYGANTILVISKIAYDDLKPGMSVVYSNRVGKLVVHQTLAREAKGWRVQGINNTREDKDRVTRENLVGVVYASLSYSDEKP
jgi:hypothetical protein